MSGRPIRVLMVTGAYHPEISSSAVQCRAIAALLAGRADVQILTTSVDPALPRHDSVDDVPVTRIRVDVRSAVSKVRAARRMILDLLRLCRWCDVVHLHGYSSKNVVVTAVAKLFGRPVVLSLHTAGFDEPAAIREHGWSAEWALRSADLCMSVSSGLVKAYLDAGLPRDRIVQVPNGIDLAKFAPTQDRSPVRSRLGLPADAPIIVFVGFFSADKQPRVLFDAWLALAAHGVTATLVFVGATSSAYFEVDGSIANSMAAEAAARGLSERLIFAGQTHDVPSYLQAADLFVLTSRREGLPVALLEAMASGLPCIASRLQGATDVIIEDGRNGLLITPGDAAALEDAMASLLADDAARARLGAAARATIESRYSIGSVADRWLSTYAMVAGRP